MAQTNIFVREAHETLRYYAEKETQCTVFATEIVAGSCLDFLVSEGPDWTNRIDWFTSRREGYLVRAPLSKKQLGRLEIKYRLNELDESFSDKQWGQGYSVTTYGDGLYGLGPGILSIVVDEGWERAHKAADAAWPMMKMPYIKLKNNIEDAGIPGQPLLWTGTPGTCPLEKLLGEPSSINPLWPKYGIALRFCANENRDYATMEIPGPDWGHRIATMGKDF
jgi:hypothetical protein